MGKEMLVEAFARGRDEGRALLMPYLVCGYPDPDAFVACARVAAEAGADLLEIGIPFSDPIMDGPVIVAASNAVLKRGQSVADALELFERASAEAGIPLMAMTYYNILYRHGLERIANEIARGGGAGAIVPDLSVEDSEPWRKACSAAGIAPIFMAAQTSPRARLQAIGAAGEGFVYAASILGVTGVREAVNEAARSLVEQVRAATSLPVAVGIGVSTPAHAREVAAYADGVIVGSALVSRITEASDPVDATRTFVAELRAACTR